MIPLGYELGSGQPIAIPPAHTVFVGQTQRAGKTTCLEALAVRSGYACLAFLTKRGEASFRMAREIPPYYREDEEFDWQTVRFLCEALTEDRWSQYQRQAVRLLCEAGDFTNAKSSVEWKQAANLEQLQHNIDIALPRAPGRIKLSLIEVKSDLRKVRRELDKLELESAVPALEAGLNVVNLERAKKHIQSLVIASMIRHVRLECEKTVIALPEAWKFANARSRTPVGDAAREFIREAAALKNFLWIDSQTLAGLSGELLSQVRVWLFGVQRYKAEVERTLDAIPDNIYPRPGRGDLAQLKLGQFVLCYDGELLPVYVQPAWMAAAHAQAIAMGEEPIETAREIVAEFDRVQGISENNS